MTTEDRYSIVLKELAARLPDAESELQFRNPFELIVAVVLSAQCTDKRVNKNTPALFAAYPDAEAMSRATDAEIFQYIKEISYPNSKAAHLKGLAQTLVEKFGGVVPQTMEELTQLPGVGRKTANVVMAVAFGKPAMPVDTHVFRVSHRLGLVPKTADTPAKVEAVLTKNIPAEILSKAHHWFLLFGRYTCTARNPKCEGCGLKDICIFTQP
ncbi:MAG: endonuclease III [Paludibacteraceae bacterium]|nr:endonuclease III [Paludibacteraceae bacterium]